MGNWTRTIEVKSGTVTIHADDLNALTAERDRYKAALEEIAGDYFSSSNLRARRALAPTDTKGE